jgi:Na+-driven multidrug efflux pump
LPGIVFNGAAKLLSQLVVQGGGQRFNLFGSAIAAVATIGLDLLLIPRFGIAGAAIASTVAYLLVLLIILITIRYRLGIPVHDLFLLLPKDIRHLRRNPPWSGLKD